jgi:hypothetical protein
LDRLVTLAEEIGERTNRKELIAAIVATIDLDGGRLSDGLRRYRTMTVRDCLPGQADDTKVIRLAERKPGPRPR